MENEIVGPRGGFWKQGFILFLMVFAIYLGEGWSGFKPFLNLEAILLVFGGTFLLTWTAYPLKEIFKPSRPEVLLYAAGCAAAMGALTTVLGMVLMLSSIDDVAQVPKRMALAFMGLFYGLILSEVVLAPKAARLAASGERTENKSAAQAGAGKRAFLWFLTLGVASFSMMTVLFALSMATPSTDRNEKSGCGITYEEMGIAAYFKSGSADVTREADAVVAKIAPTFRKLAEKYDIVVEGHTDSMETPNRSFKSSRELSAIRASNIAQILEKYGLPAKRLLVSGYGDRDQISSNDTPEGRSKNRRVVFYIKYPAYK